MTTRWYGKKGSVIFYPWTAVREMSDTCCIGSWALGGSE